MKAWSPYKLACLLVLLVAFQLRAADLKDIPPGLHFDEGRNMQRAWRWSQGYGLPLHLRDIPEPFDQIIRAEFMRLSGGIHPFVAQVFSVWLSTLAVAGVMAVAAVIYREHRYQRVIVLGAGLALAVMPPAVIIGHHFYRVNWLPPMNLLALACLVRSWREPGRRGVAVLAGIFTGLSMIFYQGAVFSPPALFLATLSAAALSGFRWPKLRPMVCMVVSFGIVILPWLYIIIRMPGWWERPISLTNQGSPLSDPAYWIPNIRSALSTLFIPSTVHIPRYNTFTTAFLNPALIVLFAAGLFITLRRWRRPWMLAPLLVGLVMMLPNIISSEPYQPVRLAGTWGPLALLAGLGMGEILCWARQPMMRRAVQVALAAVFIVSPIYTAYHVWYHYKVQPLLTNPNVPESWAYLYREGYSDLLRAMMDSDVPVYLPVEYANTDLAVARLRPVAFPTVRAYDGRPLPSGKIILPVDSIIYGLFKRDHVSAQYVLALPDTGEIVILPPLLLSDARTLEQRIQQTGDDLTNNQGWTLGQVLNVSALDNPFNRLRYTPGEPLAVFDGRLELLAIDAPDVLTPGEPTPVTLYWRLTEATGKDYFARLQAWDSQNTNQSQQLGSTIVNEGGTLLTIFSYLYPTVMWQAGEIVPETHWITVFDSAPDGAYRFAVGVYDYPGPTPVSAAPVPGMAQTQDSWLLAGRARIGALASVPDINGVSLPVNAQLGDSIRLNHARLNPPPDELQPGAPLNLQLDWQAIQPIAESYTLFVHVVDAGGRLVAQQDTLPFDGQYPTWAWMPGETVTTTHTLNIPADAQAPLHVTVGLYAYPSLERLPVVQNGVESPDRLVLLTTDG